MKILLILLSAVPIGLFAADLQPSQFAGDSESAPYTDDTWDPTSTINAPVPRSFHTTVWTGSEMIVWGGFVNLGLVNTGGRYTAGNNSWTATSITNAPSPRYSHTAIWSGSEMIVWGGDGYEGYLNTGGRYNLSTHSWTATEHRQRAFC